MASHCWCLFLVILVPIAVLAVALFETPSVATLPVVSDDSTCESTFTSASEASYTAETGLSRTFDRLAPVYDWTNRWLSLGLAERWHQKLVQDCLRPAPGDHILDLATGTAEVALLTSAKLRATSQQGFPVFSIVGVDPSLGMLQQAAIKAEVAGVRSSLRLLQGRAEDLATATDIDVAVAAKSRGVASGSVDKIAMAFGMGHLSDRKRAFSEMRRVLRPNGRVCILDFSLPAGEAPAGRLARELLARLAHLVAKIASLASPNGSDEEASELLERSVTNFPKPLDLVSSMGHEGLPIQTITSFAFGSVHLYEATLNGDSGCNGHTDLDEVDADPRSAAGAPSHRSASKATAAADSTAEDAVSDAPPPPESAFDSEVPEAPV